MFPETTSAEMELLAAPKATADCGMSVACVGGGPAGLYFAILMKAHGPDHDVRVFERNPPGLTYGWGVVFWDDLLEELEAGDPETASQIRASSFRWNGQLLAVDDKEPVHVGGHGYGIGRQRLLDILVERARDLGVQVEFEREIESADELLDADLIVASDGVNSPLRDLHRGRYQTDVVVGRNKYIWLGTSRVFDAFTFAFVPTDAGWIWCHAYGFDTSTSTFIAECSPETWTGLGFDRLDESQSIRLLERLFERQLQGEGLQSKARPTWLNFRTVTNEKWRTDNVVLMGDAAHTTHFTIGSGTRLALEDAISLATSLQTEPSLATALERYETERRRALARTQSEARFSARWFENVSRYIDLEPRQAFALLMERRSPLLPHIPARVYYGLSRATQNNAALRKLRRWVAPAVKGAYRRAARGAM
jgi:2-polyprenyl-6-methoxyphenol hydroxylase-like FAD-dependent oxidoreductase